MDKVVDTWIASPKRPPAAGGQPACLVHIYPTDKAIGSRYPLADKPLVVGRGEDCDIRVPENSVSRKHARIDPDPAGYAVTDLGSTNGTFVNDAPTSGARPLKDGDYVRIGNCIYRFLTGGNVEAEYHEEIYRLTIIDALTQTFNRRYLMDFLDREVVRSNRHDRPLAVVLFDIDHFKKVNDDLGHLGGDFALRELANVVRHGVRREDLFARYGGEEFALVLVETSREQALEVAERLRQSVEQHRFTFENQPVRITISLGVAECTGSTTLTAGELLKQADEKLYQAKRAGRNRVVI